MAVAIVLLQDLAEFAMQGDLAQMKVDESRAGEFDLVDELAFGDVFDDCRCDVPRVLAFGFSEAHRDVGREIPMPGIACPLDRRRYR